MTVAQQSAVTLRKRLQHQYPTVRVQALRRKGEVVPTILVRLPSNAGGVPSRFRGMRVVIEELS